MRYPLKFLQRAGLVSTLLIGGVLGGLMAPLHSEAGTPELTLQIDGVPAGTDSTVSGATLPGVSILGSKTTCTAADVNVSYTDCYGIKTSTTTSYPSGDITTSYPSGGAPIRYYRVQNAPTATARLRMGDNVGQDFFSVAGVQFVPLKTANQAVATVTDWLNVSPTYANTLEEHTLTIRMKASFDNRTVNVNNASNVVTDASTTPPKTVGPVAHGLRSGGEFDAGPVSPPTTLFCFKTTTTNGVLTIVTPLTPVKAKCDAVNNSVTYTGKGTFSSAGEKDILSPSNSLNNTQILSLTVGDKSATLPKVSFDGLTNATMGQVTTYPQFDCISSVATKCLPNINLTMTVKTKGPDIFVLTGGPDYGGSSCTIADSTRLTSELTSFASLVAAADKLEKLFPNKQFRAIIDQALLFLANFNSTPPQNCHGEKNLTAFFTIEAFRDQLAFFQSKAVPADIAPMTGTITITKHVPCGDCSGQSGVVFTFHIDGPSPSTQMITTSGSDNTSITVPVLAGHYSMSEDAASGWQQDSSNCAIGDITGFDVPSGGNVTCTFNNIKTPPTTITINKTKPDCLGGCSGFPFYFDIVGPTTMLGVVVNIGGDGTNGTSGALPVLPGDYTVTEVDHYPASIGETLNSITNLRCGGGSTSVSVVVTTNKTCTFENYSIPQ